MYNDQKNKDFKYVIYARRSLESDKKDKEENVNSIDDQLNTMKQVALSHGLNIVKEFKETCSAKEPGTRAVFTEMIKYIESGKANAILCWNVNRLSRNAMDSGVLQHLLVNGRIQEIRTPSNAYKSADNIILLSVESAMSSEYLRKLIEDVTRGLHSAAARGFRPSIAPIGYKNSKYREQDVQEEILYDEHNGPLVRKIFDYVLSGQYTAYQVLKIASEEWGFRTRKSRKYPDGRKFSKTNIYNILSNPFYYGEFEYPAGSGKWHKGNHKPIISRGEFDEVQRILKKTAIRPKHRFFAYTGLMRCGGCGARITCEAKTKRQKNGNVHHYNYYHCTGMIDPNCKSVSVREDRLEEQFIEYLKSLQIPQAIHEWALQQLEGEYEREKNDKGTILFCQHRELQVVSQKLINLKNLVVSGVFTPEEYQEEKIKFEEEQKRLQGQIELVESKVKTWIDDARRLFTFSERAVEEFMKGDEHKRKAIISALGTEHVLDNGKIRMQTEKPLPVMQEIASVGNSSIERLEPVKSIVSKGSFQQNTPFSELMWRWRESNPRLYE